MKTQELLALWRERWEKPPQEVLLRPLTNGRLAQKLRQLALANFWQIPGLAAVCGVIFFSLASMPLTMVAQIFVSGFLCFFAVILHRPRGLVPSLFVTGIAVFFLFRYFIYKKPFRTRLKVFCFEKNASSCCTSAVVPSLKFILRQLLF